MNGFIVFHCCWLIVGELTTNKRVDHSVRTVKRDSPQVTGRDLGEEEQRSRGRDEE